MHEYLSAVFKSIVEVERAEIIGQLCCHANFCGCTENHWGAHMSIVCARALTKLYKLTPVAQNHTSEVGKASSLIAYVDIISK